MTWRDRSVFSAPFAAASANALHAAGIHTIGQLSDFSDEERGDRLPDLTSAQLDGVTSVLDHCRAGAVA